MSRMIFVNLPVTDLERSKAFYEAIGSRNEPKFTNEAAAMMVAFGHHLRHAPDSPLLCNVHPQADCRRQQQQPGAALHLVRQPGRGRPDHRRRGRRRRQGRSVSPKTGRWAGRCTAAASRIPTAIIGSRCGWTRRSPNRARIRSKARQPNPPRNIRSLGGKNASQSERRDRDHRLSLGARVRPGRGPRPARPLGARGGRARLSRSPARPGPAERISQGTAVRPGARASATARSRSSRAARSSNISARRARRCCRAIAQGKYRAIQWTYAALNSVEPAILNLLLIDVFFAGEEWAKLRRPGAEDFARLKLKRVSDWLGDKEWLEGDRFTIGDLIMVTTLRFLRHTDLVAELRQPRRFLETRRSAPRIPARASRPARRHSASINRKESAA